MRQKYKVQQTSESDGMFFAPFSCRENIERNGACDCGYVIGTQDKLSITATLTVRFIYGLSTSF